MRLAKLSTLAVFVLLGSLAAAQAATYEKGSILDIQPRPNTSPVPQSTDAPPPPMQATYDLTVQIADMVYVSRYEHESDYLPSNWVVGQSVDARVGKHKHRIYVKDVQGHEVPLVIVTRHPVKAK